MSSEYQTWIRHIQVLNFNSVLNSLQNLVICKNNDESNKYLFKILLHLAHSADKCKKQQLSKEIEIFKITKIICENLSIVSDKDKFYSAIYFIIQYLLSKQYFEEAKIISSYLFPGKILSANNSYKTKEYYQIVTLWQVELFKKLDLITTNNNSEKAILNDEFLFCLKFLLQILDYCDENVCYTFKIAESFIKKLINIPMLIAFPSVLQIFQHLSNYFTELKKYPLINAYHYIIFMFGQIFLKRNDCINNSDNLSYFRQIDILFIEPFKSSPEIYHCYKIFREFTINLFETNYMSKDIGKIRIKKCFDSFEAVLQKYGKDNKSLTETLMAVANSFETLFGNLEGLVAKQLMDVNITYDDIVYIGDFVKKVYSILRNRKLPVNYSCASCSDPNACKVKTDMYKASITTFTYLRVISRCNKTSISEKMFLLAKDLLDEMVSVFNELEQIGCKYSVALWNLCGKMIFNIGLITESKYPEELENLYKVLCKQIVCFDGLDSKISSFGLQYPVSTALTRLCNSYFNREIYRKAMFYTAYNALVSINESKKKKACDMWATIKLKNIDSVEIQELTMIKCLKTDADIIKELGITVNIHQYNLADLCLRELKSLFPVQSNIIIAMKKTLEELESVENSLYYGQGVLLLSFHALQFEKREIISDYILKAIVKLTNSKSKSFSSQCILANLNFFRVLEKLYVRKQAITEQIEDANFTVKAFQTFKSKQENEEDSEEKDEIVPTYGGINIEEDNRCANELREVLSIWDSCFQKNLSSVVNDWEPKFTLETIMICGEYCRLYKFNDVEEKTWRLAYKLATALQDFTTCVYVTSRCLSLRCINDKWISDAEKQVEKLKHSTKIPDTDSVTLFWLSLADFYLDCKKIKEAKQLLKKVKVMPNFDILGNYKLYIYYVDIQFRNFYILNEKASQEDYSNLLVQAHYLLISLHDIIAIDPRRFWTVRNLLFVCEQLFEVNINIIIPMVSLLSFREITAHMTFGLTLAQKYGFTLRIAQYLKYFCYIDLLRLHAENCETRLQDLEHILCLENFKKSMNTKFANMKIDPKISNTVTFREAVHDPVSLSKNSASPELKKKLFTLPEFLRHTPHCQCFICNNINYQYLSFSCVHIRAQLYSLLKYKREAEQYFHGAFKIKSNINERDLDTHRQYKSYKWCRHQNIIVDFIWYLLDFSLYIVDFEPEDKDDALALIEEALNVASQNDLDKHCITVYATELYYQHFVYNLPQDKLCKYTIIENSTDIPITITNQPSTGCVTPKQHIEKTARNPRRRKTPPAVPIVNIVDLSDEENDIGNSLLPKSPPIIQPTKTRTRARNVRRKILVDEVDDKEETSKLTRTRSMKSKEKEEETKPTRSRSMRLKN
ncbi:uncharacterized protein LOC131672704 isoform X2 [Phymastichus coffea]|uniref:uncharacterized protein LOC131672704 isoform X2 n=1 Tax=Phymastichus coffea TaxID=108790 RepID=UPI00273B79DE|nr:uncharacterized protein LOC131672704 isoform X2 [Phymastichus coffea]